MDYYEYRQALCTVRVCAPYAGIRFSAWGCQASEPRPRNPQRVCVCVLQLDPRITAANGQRDRRCVAVAPAFPSINRMVAYSLMEASMPFTVPLTVPTNQPFSVRTCMPGLEDSASQKVGRELYTNTNTHVRVANQGIASRGDANVMHNAGERDRPRIRVGSLDRHVMSRLM